jgi:hypothetical protein
MRRGLLHPLTPAAALGVLVLIGAAAALRGTAASGALLACAAGCAAGFANSGST